MVITTRLSIHSLHNTPSSVFTIRCLTNVAAYKLLLMKSSRRIPEKEEAELRKAAVPEKLRKHNPDLCRRSEKITDHPLVRLLGGHPQAITLAAGYLNDHNLPELFNQLASAENALEILDDPYSQSNKVGTLNMHLNLSIEYVKQECEEALYLFGLLGYLPSGADSNELNELWNVGIDSSGSHDWKKLKSKYPCQVSRH